MSRYIDLDEIRKRLDDCPNKGYVDMDEIPPADVVEVVRCKDCKHYAGEGMYCAQDICVQFDHFFCYYAERREE